MSKPVCIIDFCGSMGGEQTEFWADYNTDTGVTVFGGAWEKIPDLTTDHEPTVEELEKWVEDHGGKCYG